MADGNLRIPTIPMRYCEPIFDMIQKRGIAFSKFSSERFGGITPPNFEGRRLYLCECIALMEFAARETQEPDLGLTLGKGYSIHDLGIIGYMMLNSTNVEQALNIFIRYFRIRADGCRFDLIKHEQKTARLLYSVIAPGISECRQDVELALSWCMRIMRTLVSETWRPVSVEFKHDALALMEDYSGVFRAPVNFGREQNAIVFDKIVLERQIRNADSRLLDILKKQAEALLSTDHSTTDFESIVEAQIDQAFLLGRAPRIDTIAKQLHMSTRTLQRRLETEGLQHRSLVDCRRKIMSKELLEKSAFPLSDISMILGYSEVSAFVRAFTRWTGVPPQYYRKHSNAGTHRAAAVLDR